MDTMILDCKWRIEGPLMIGTGISRAGYADSIIRTESGGELPIIPGDAVKGAIRQSAEHLLRWLMDGMGRKPPGIDREDSFPNHPVVRRIFAPAYYEPFYRFGCNRVEDKGKMRFASTAIDSEAGIARGHSLRMQEVGVPGSIFKITVSGRGGKWSDPTSKESLDLIFLAAAILSTEAVGGRKGVGLGRTEVLNMGCRINGAERKFEWSAGLLDSVKKHLAMEG